jgi:sec-independent protein translocase protein TatC
MAQDKGGRPMTIGEHLEELRSRLLRCLWAVMIGFGFCFWQIEAVMDVIQLPLVPLLMEYPDHLELVQTKVYSAFAASMKIAFLAGCFLASPLILQQIWGFVGAGLYKHERKSLQFYALPGFLLFFAGASMAYFFVLPFATRFLVEWSLDLDVNTMLDLSPFVSFIALGVLVFGLMFQLPLVMVFLMRLGVVQPQTFRKYRRHAIVANVALAMIVTPPDVFSQLILAGCMTVLYEGALIVGGRVARPRRETSE